MSKKDVMNGDIGRCLITENFYALTGELAHWRTNPQLTLMEQKKSKGRILGFVKGLRFSARIAYLVRDILVGKNLHVSWGHLIDTNGKSCSPECDIIIHKPGWHRKWNQGGKHPIMDFKFVICTEAIAVISCKSLTISIDRNYCKALQPYMISNVFLFSECCSPSSLERLEKQAKESGYVGFYCLYTIKKDADTFSVNEKGIMEFINKIDALIEN